MYQVVIDTNVVAAALLSNRGASHRLLRLVGDHRWRINLSVPLVSMRQRESAPDLLSLATIPARSKG
jgi:predicted nucleic acid-binding protein